MTATTAPACDYVRHPDMRILSLLAGHSASFKKLWSYPNQETICKLFVRLYGRDMSRRSLNRHLGALERQGYVQRVRRHKRARSGVLELHSTLYMLRRRAIRMLALLRSAVALIGPGKAKNAGNFRCANPGTTFDSSNQNNRRAAPKPGAAPPKGDKESALRALAELKKRLQSH